MSVSELFWSTFLPHFPTFGLNTERYGVFSRMQENAGKMPTRVTPNTDTFYAVNDVYVFRQRIWFIAPFHIHPVYFFPFFTIKPATLIKITLLHGCFSRFLNCTNCTKTRKASHISCTRGRREKIKEKKCTRGPCLLHN